MVINLKDCLGIIGGVGPLASSYLYEMITKNTKATSDQEHLDIILFSHASIPDRTAYILDNSNKNPYPYLLEDCKKLEKMGALMISIPCNTSCYFHEKLQEEIKIPISNIIKNTVKFISDKGYKKIAILATLGTLKSRLYQEELERYNIEYSCPYPEKVMEVIYNYVKSGKEVPLDLWNEITLNCNVDAFILGCTELSILKKELKLDDRFIDPLEIETKNILNFFDKN